MRKIRFIVPILLLAVMVSAAVGESFHFTVTADPRSSDVFYGKVLAAMKSKIGGQGAFQVVVGDLDPPGKLRAKVDALFGKSAMWFAVMGNHDESPKAMPWIKDEYGTGHDGRAPLKTIIAYDGPRGAEETTYSWNYGNCHCIFLNEYWNGGTGPGSDEAKGGRIVPALLAWIKNDLEHNKKPVVFVFGHEPAFPEHRHIHDSLDRNPKSRDAFWKLLESMGVQAYFCGHTHYYSRHREPGGHVWQIDAGSTRNADKNGSTFVNVTVSDKSVRYDAWRDHGTGSFSVEDTWNEPVKR